MRFFNIFRYDIRYGLISKPQRFIVITLFSVFLFITFTFNIFHLFVHEVNGISDINSLSLSYGDVILQQLGAHLPALDASVVESFAVPTQWLLMHILICYFSLNYLSEDLLHGGIQVISRAKSKKLWWASKCLWNISTVCSCYFVGYGILYALCILTGKDGSFTLNPFVFKIVFSEILPNQTKTSCDLFLYLCLLPTIVGITVNLLQMTLTLYVKPVFAFVASCVYFISGLYYANPLMLSNYAMPVRSRAIGIYSFDFLTGVFLCVTFSFIAILVGSHRIRLKDIN